MDKPFYVNKEEGKKKIELDATMHDFPEHAIRRDGDKPHISVKYGTNDVIVISALPGHLIGINYIDEIKPESSSCELTSFEYKGKWFDLWYKPI